MFGGQGDDRICGNVGADRFVFIYDSGVDTLTGFSSGEGDTVAVAANVNATGIARFLMFPSMS